MTTATATRNVTIRPAYNAEGHDLARLAKTAGFNLPDLDWSLVSPYWLVAEYEDRLIGCIQLCPSVPIARLEMLCMETDLPHRVKALAVKSLLIDGCAALVKMGAQYVSGLVDEGLAGYERVLKKRGAFLQSKGHLYLMKVRG
jgi:hypothetical protein